MPRYRRIAKWAAVGAGAAVTVVLVATALAIVLLQGERLAGVIRSVMPEMQGRIEMRSMTWRGRALLDLLSDTPTPISVEGLRITDPEGIVVFVAPRLDVLVRPRSAIGGKIFLHELRVGPGSRWRFAAMKTKEGNGFLGSFAPKAASPPSPERPEEVTPDAEAFHFEIVDAHLDGLTAVFDFEAWGLELRNIKAPASLVVSGDFVGWDVQGLDARDGGFLRILQEVLPFDRVEVARVATTRDWPDSIFLDVLAAKTGRSTLVGRGYFSGIYGYGYKTEPVPGIDMHAELHDAADALAAVAAGHAVLGLTIGGQGAKVVLDLKEPFERLSIGANVSGLDVRFGSYRADQLAARARVVVDPLKLNLDELTFLAPGGGRFSLGAELAGSAFKGRLKLDRFTTGGYVPRDVKKLAGGKISGHVAFAGNMAKQRATVSSMDLRLGRPVAAGLPKSIRVHGQATATAGKVSTDGITVEVPGASAEVRGEVQLARKMVALALRVTTSDLPYLFGMMEMTPLARGLAAFVDIQGSFDNPRARGDLVVQGLGVTGFPELPQIAARFRLQDGTFIVDSLTGGALGGTLEGAGSVQLYRKTLDRMLRSPVVSFQLDGRDLELGTLVSYSVASGRFSLHATANGPVDALRARVTLPPGTTLSLFGKPASLEALDITVEEGTIAVRAARLSWPGGARLDVEGTMSLGARGALSWKIKVRDVALETLLATSGVPVAGRLSADLAVGGDTERPAITGTISVASFALRGKTLGDANFEISSTGTSGLALKGNLFRRIDLEANASFGAEGPRASASVRFNQLKLEELVPEMVHLGDGRGVTSGILTAAWRPEQPLLIDARLSELSLSVSRPVERVGMVPQRVSLRNAGDIHLVVSGNRIVLDPARLVTDGTELKLAGELVGDVLKAAISGHLRLDLLQPFLGGQMERLTGDIEVDLGVEGLTSSPRISGTLAISRAVTVRPVGFESDVVVPSGSLRLGGDTLDLRNLAISVDGATLTIQGRTKLDEQFLPTTIDLSLAGEISAGLLPSLLPESLTEASGRARLSAQISGTLAAPKLQAHLDLGHITLVASGVGREIAIESGVLDLTQREAVLRDVKVRLDDQGLVLIGADGLKPGRVLIEELSFKDGAPTVRIGRLDLPLKGERMTFSQPGTFEMDDLGFSLALTGDLQSGLKLRGDVRIISGRYMQDFDVRDLVLSPRMSESSRRSLWEGRPLLENLALDLRVRTIGDSFIIQNNIAPEIHIVIDLYARGTLSDPIIAGDVRPTDGRFDIPGVRGEFELVPNVSHITFVETKSIPAGETPELALEAESLVVDAQQKEHTIRMRISGPVGQAAIDLSTTDGLDRNQTLLLLLAGRTNDDAGRFGTRNPNAGLGLGADVMGELSRDTVANLIEPYIDDTLQLLTGRKINLRPTVGTDGFELKVGARASRHLDLQLSFRRGFQSDQRYRAEGSLWVMDYLTLRGYWEQLTLAPQQNLTEEIDRVNLELTLDFPLRLWHP